MLVRIYTDYLVPKYLTDALYLEISQMKGIICTNNGAPISGPAMVRIHLKSNSVAVHSNGIIDTLRMPYEDEKLIEKIKLRIEETGAGREF